MYLTKFLFVQIFLLCSLMLSASSQASDEPILPPIHLISPTNLQEEAQLAAESKSPLLILFSMEGCLYCRFIEEDHLKPMLRNADYRSKVIIRRVMTDDYSNFIDFDGKTISSLDFAQRYNSTLTPTVLFLDDQGNAIKRIVGVRNTEYYGGELDEGLRLSLLKMRHEDFAHLDRK